MAAHLASIVDGSGGFGELRLDPSCEAVRSVHAGWQATPFMYGPLATSLLLPLPASAGTHLVERQRHARELLSSRMAKAKLTDYYSGSWIAITTATLNGDFAKACSRIFLRGCNPTPVEA